MIRYGSFLATIAGLLFSAGCGSDPPQPNGSEPAPVDQSATAPPSLPALHSAFKEEHTSPTSSSWNRTDARGLLATILAGDQPRILLYEGRRAEWAAAPEVERLRACLLFSMTKCRGLDDYGYGIMANRFVNTVDDFYQQIEGEDKVIEILALTLLLDGQEWLQELGGETLESRLQQPPTPPQGP